MMRIEDKEWSEFAIENILLVKPGKRLTKADMMVGKKPFIGSTDANNGITAFVSNKNVSEDSNVLGINYNGSVGECFYHPYKSIFTDDVKRLSLKDRVGNKYIYFFFKNSILKQKNKYQYSYKFNEKRLKRQKILLPVNKQNEIDYQFMENYSKSILMKKRRTYMNHIKQTFKELTYQEIIPLQDKEWKEFFIIEIFDTIQRGKRLTKANQTEGNIPYVSSTASNNGVDNFIGNTKDVRIFENCITIANSGSVGASFYHPYRFVASDHVTHLQKEEMSEYIYLFISTLTNRFSKKYNFNREINDTRISREKILLPVNDINEPDYEYMEQYMKNLKYQKIKQYLDYLAKQQDKFE